MLDRFRCLMPLAVLALAFVAAWPHDASAQRGLIPVNIESTPAGATVYVDSTETPPVGTTPLTNARLPRGRHTLIFKLANHEDGQLPVDVRRRRETFRITLHPLGRVVVSAGNPDAQGATVKLDGQPSGTVPLDQTVQPGRHLVQVEREGFNTYQQWVDIAGGQVVTIPVLLQRSAPEPGSLLVAADVPTARVSVDGQARGQTPLVLDGLSEGEHVVEVTAEGENIQPHRETVRIRAGERTTINAVLRVTPTGGTIRVISNAPNAVIRLDGEVLGNAPVTRENVPVGEHIVEAAADGSQPTTQTVTVEAGRQRVVNMHLAEAERRPGRIVVNANVDGARVWVDGNERGAPPVVVDQAPSGTHAIIVRAPGYQEFRGTCTVAPEQDCTVDASLEPVGTPVRVEANVGNAEFFVDGELVGPIPWEGTLPVGTHLLEVRAQGYRPHSEQIALRVSQQTRSFYVTLVGENELSPEERRAEERERQLAIHQAVSHSAAVLPEDLALMDVSTGWPYLGELRLGIGLHRLIEAGVAFRTFGILNEFEGRVKVGYRPIRQVSVAGQVRFGGGIGPSRTDNATDTNHSTNSVFFSLEALMSLHFARAGAFTFWGAFDLTSDRWDWTENNRSVLSMDTDRQTIGRGRFGGALEFTLNKRLNIWGLFEGVIGHSRRIYGDIFGREIAGDTEMYGRVGITLKFGNIWDDEELEEEPVDAGMMSTEPEPAPASDPSWDVAPATEPTSSTTPASAPESAPAPAPSSDASATAAPAPESGSASAVSP